MDTILYLVFVIAAGLSQRSYFDALAQHSSSVISLRAAGEELQGRPGEILRIVPSRTKEYLRALITRQEDSDLEFKRLRAVGMIVAMIFVFVFIVGS